MDPRSLLRAFKAFWSSQSPDHLQFLFISLFLFIYTFTPPISFLPHLLPGCLSQSHYAIALYSQTCVIALQLSRLDLKF